MNLLVVIVMLALPRELLTKVAPRPIDMRSLHRVCREIKTRTDGIYSYVVTCKPEIGRTSLELVCNARYVANLDTKNRCVSCWPNTTTPRGYTGTLMTCIYLWGSWISAEYVLLVDTGDGLILTGITTDTETLLQFIGVCFKKVYKVVGAYNNFSGKHYSSVINPAGKYTFAAPVVNTITQFAIYHTDAPLVECGGVILAIEPVTTDDFCVCDCVCG